ncbi:hypothetical protein [Calidifontibacillus oryziterrae]|uniref:hypothetical protein n=1 Tax=Calidifontibacillus oryziterrae TaxID=1191699 RepID=UPI00030FA7CA|nr:hypothetical protein [Calidifontibacillus oryziterrae]
MRKLEGQEAQMMKKIIDEGGNLIFELDGSHYQISPVISTVSSKKQRDEMTKVIFQNKEVLKQLRDSETENIYIENEEDFMKIIKEVQHGR